MRRLFRRNEHEINLDRMFQTRSHAWEQVGLARQISMRAARRARREAVLLLPMLAGILLVYSYRRDLFGKSLDMPVRIGTVIALLALGWAFARAVGQAIGPSMFRRMDPATAGTVGFLLRLVTILITFLAALRIAGLSPQSIALGGAFTAVVFGLAAQQTLGNVIAGTVLLSARPFRVGERVRLQAGGVAGTVEGVVSSLGLLYLTLANGEDRIMIPNSVALNAAVVPLREPDAVDMRARLPARTRPSELEALLQERITVRMRRPPDIELEEMEGEWVVVRITATPEQPRDGARLADEVIAVVSRFATDPEGPTVQHVSAGAQTATPATPGADGQGTTPG